MLVSSKKNKGRKLQYYIANKIAELLDIKFDSKDDTCPIKSRLSGQIGSDIYFTDKTLYEKFFFDCECKNQESPSIKSWIEQAKNNTKENRNWLLFWKHKGLKKPVVIMDSEIFFLMLKEIRMHLKGWD
jgi:hypothetical protein